MKRIKQKAEVMAAVTAMRASMRGTGFDLRVQRVETLEPLVVAKDLTDRLAYACMGNPF